MKKNSEENILLSGPQKEEFNWGATLTVLFLLLAFIGASFYILVSSYMEIG